MDRPYRPYVVVMVFVTSIWAAPDAAACSCGAGGCGDVAKADAVFVARVDRIEADAERNVNEFELRQRAVHLSAVRPLRGEPQSIVLTGFDGGDCGYQFQPGADYLIVAHRRPTDGRLTTSICSSTQPLAEAGALIAYIESLNRPFDGGRVWGRVRLDTPGTNLPSALSGARVSIRGPVEASTTTDSEGHYGFAKLPPGQYVVTAAPPDDRTGLVPMPSKEISLEVPPACSIVDFVAKNDGRIRGRVVGPGGTPVANLLVYRQPVPFEYGASLEYGAETDANGTYEFLEVPQGRYRVGINFLIGPNTRLPYPISSARTATGADVVDVAPGGDVELLPLVLTPLTPVTVNIVVQLEDGTPVNDVIVAADAAGTVGPFVTEQALKPVAPGLYRMTLYRETSYRILVIRAQKTLRTLDITASDTSVVITLPPTQ